MFPYRHDTAPHGEAAIPQWHPTAYPRVETQYTSPEPRYGGESSWGRPIYPNYQTMSHPTGLHPTLPGSSRHPATTESNWAIAGYPTNQSFVPRWPEMETNGMPPVNPINTGDPLFTEDAALREWARIRAERFYQGTDPELQEELERTYNNSIRKRWRSPKPDPGAGPSQCTVAYDDRGSDDRTRTTRTKRRRETGDRAATQRVDTQKQRVGRTSAGEKIISKLGTQGLAGRRILVAPSQGVYPPHPPGATTSETTLGSTESRHQAWNEGGQRMEDAHDEEETDRARWERLIYHEGGQWKCRECNGKEFRDRSSSHRHCRTSVHAKKRDIRKCPLCTKGYLRKSGLNRHIKEKHREVGGPL